METIDVKKKGRPEPPHRIERLEQRVRVLELELLDRKVKQLEKPKLVDVYTCVLPPIEEVESVEQRLQRLEYFMRCLFPPDKEE